jgi:hypothetical protein
VSLEWYVGKGGLEKGLREFGIHLRLLGYVKFSFGKWRKKYVFCV